MRESPIRNSALIAVVCAAALGGSAAAQGTSSAPDVLGALLTEVRGLRSAMEQIASAGPRIELALGRLQLQEQRVNVVLRRHTEVRDRLASTERESSDLSQQIEALQLALHNVMDESERKSLQEVLAQTKRRQGVAAVELQRLGVEEAEAAQLVATEQGRWTELNQRLEDLERALIKR